MHSQLDRVWPTHLHKGPNMQLLYVDYEIPLHKSLNLGSTDPSSHCGAVLLGGEEENLLEPCTELYTVACITC